MGLAPSYGSRTASMASTVSVIPWGMPSRAEDGVGCGGSEVSRVKGTGGSAGWVAVLEQVQGSGLDPL